MPLYKAGLPGFFFGSSNGDVGANGGGLSLLDIIKLIDMKNNLKKAIYIVLD